VQENDAADVNANAEVLRRKQNEAQKEEAEKLHARQRKQEKREEAASQHQRLTRDQQPKPCVDGQCEGRQNASTIANKKELHQ
jgi:hypothetical protein